MMEYNTGFQNGAAPRGGFSGGVRGACYNCMFFHPVLEIVFEDEC